MSAGTKMEKAINWPIVAFFGVTTAGAVVGAPLYVHRFGISIPEILLTLFFVLATGLSITVGYHRLYAHSTFKASPVVQFLTLFFGAAAFEQSALTWSSGHRDHHRYVDTERDPYSIKKGFWYAHIGWMTLWKQHPNYNNAKDLLKNKLVMHQHDHYVLWGAGAGILFPVLLGALTGHALGALVFAVCVRLTFVYHATFCINSVCHTFGKATYDIHATARDNWFTAVLTNGEGYHNFHHRFPTDYRNGVRWYHWDPSKWAIAVLARLGLAWELKKVSNFSVLEAKLAAENQALCEHLMILNDHNRIAQMRERLQSQYASMIQHLRAWEASVRAYRAALSATMASRSDEFREAALEQIREAKSNFEIARRQWDALTRSRALDLQYI
jgi:stearoyl-CoA desaturase (delta-9 desaturase)